MVDVDKSLVSQNGGFVLIYRHFHLPFKQGVRSSNLRWVTKRNTTTNVVVFFYSLFPCALSIPQYPSLLRRMLRSSQALQLAQHVGRRERRGIMVF